jgi:hypothetical protein
VKRLALLGAVACAALAAAAPAGATNECRGLMVCVPVAGPWVLAPARDVVQYQLSCPRRYIVGGLDAELTDRSIDVNFLGGLGSPVNPGVTTTGDAVFLGRFVGTRAAAASFRPHIGCIPANGGGQRVPTAYHRTAAFPPGHPTVRIVKELPVSRGETRRLTLACAPRDRLTSATHAIAFYTQQPPTAAMAAGVKVKRSVRSGRVQVIARGTNALNGVRAVVQVDLVCAVGT